MTDLDARLKVMIGEEIIPPFRGKSECSDFDIFATYLIAYGVVEKEYPANDIADYRNYLITCWLQPRYIDAFNYIKENCPELVAEKFQDILNLEEERDLLTEKYQQEHARLGRLAYQKSKGEMI